MSKNPKPKTQLDRIEEKLDEVLAFRDQLNDRIEGLLGKSDGLLSGPLMSMVLGGLRNGGREGAGKSG